MVYIMIIMESLPKLSVEVVEARLYTFFRDRPEILLAYLFGSLLTTSTRIPRDLDLAVLVNSDRLETMDREAPYGYPAELNTAIMAHLKINRVDLTLLHRASPVLTYQVIHTGRLIFSRSEEIRHEFEISALKRHADTRYLRRIKRTYSEKRIAIGLSAYD